MGFSHKREWGLLVVLLSASFGTARTRVEATAEISVLVMDSAQVPQDILERAESDAGRIFGAAGVEVAWINCPTRGLVNDACHRVPANNLYVLRLVPDGRTSNDSVFGEAFLGEDGSGRYCDLFLNRIEGAQRESGGDVAQLLGTVAAHELGHLLLGLHAHSGPGLMEPVWREDTLRLIGMGRLFFTGEQSIRMRSRIQSLGRTEPDRTHAGE